MADLGLHITLLPISRQALPSSAATCQNQLLVLQIGLCLFLYVFPVFEHLSVLFCSVLLFLEFRRTLIGHIELQGTAASFYKALLKGELSCTAQCLVDHEPRKNDPDAFKTALELHGPNPNFRLALGRAGKGTKAKCR